MGSRLSVGKSYSRCITRGSRLHQQVRQLMNAWLSHWNSMAFPAHWGPHNAAASTIGNNSFAVMFTCAHDSGQRPWNQAWEVQAPKPHDLDASDHTMTCGIACNAGKRWLVPLHPGANNAHHCRSDLNSRFSRRWWWSSCAVAERPIILRRKQWPNRITVAACCSSSLLCKPFCHPSLARVVGGEPAYHPAGMQTASANPTRCPQNWAPWPASSAFPVLWIPQVLRMLPTPQIRPFRAVQAVLQIKKLSR